MSRNTTLPDFMLTYIYLPTIICVYLTISKYSEVTIILTENVQKRLNSAQRTRWKMILNLT